MRSRGPALAAVPGWTLLTSAVLAAALLALLGRDPARLLEAIRWGVVALALGVAGIFDDPSAELHASLPTPDRRVRLLAIGVAAPLLLGAWTGLTWLGDQALLAGPRVDAAFADCVALARHGLGIEAVGVVVLTLAAAAFAARRGSGVGSAIAGGTTAVTLYAGRLALPEQLTLAAGPLDGRWQPGQQLRWAVLVIAGAAALVFLAGDRWRRPNGWRTTGVVVVALLTVTAFTATGRPRDPLTVLDQLVESQELAAVDVSARGPASLEVRRGGAPGEVAVLDVSVVTPRRTTQAHVLMSGSIDAAMLRSWSASLPTSPDPDSFKDLVRASPPDGLHVRGRTQPASGHGLAEVVVDHRTGQAIAAVASPGRRSCGVAVASALHAVLDG